jgi:cytochrome oxidase Cu insertion factor (SCO1/SenC/PrrC family)
MRQRSWFKALALAVLLGINLLALASVGKLPLGGGQAVEAAFLERAEGRRALAFFGFPGCSQSCPMTLGRLAAAYPQLRQQAPGLTVFFVNLQPFESRSRTAAYLASYHSAFQPVAPDADTLSRLSRTFGAWLYETGAEQEPFHNSYVYVMARGDDGWQIQARVPADSEVVRGVRRHLNSPPT